MENVFLSNYWKRDHSNFGLEYIIEFKDYEQRFPNLNL